MNQVTKHLSKDQPLQSMQKNVQFERGFKFQISKDILAKIRAKLDINWEVIPLSHQAPLKHICAVCGKDLSIDMVSTFLLGHAIKSRPDLFSIYIRPTNASKCLIVFFIQSHLIPESNSFFSARLSYSRSIFLLMVQL